MRNLKNKQSILSLDREVVEKNMKYWSEEREKKGFIYRAFGEYIEFLEEKLKK